MLVGWLVGGWVGRVVRPSIGAAEGMIMSSATVQMTCSCMGELVLLQLQDTGFVAGNGFHVVKVTAKICSSILERRQYIHVVSHQS